MVGLWGTTLRTGVTILGNNVSGRNEPDAKKNGLCIRYKEPWVSVPDALPVGRGVLILGLGKRRHASEKKANRWKWKNTRDVKKGITG